MNKMIQMLRKSELHFIFALVLLNLYCAFALRGESFVDATHLMMAVIMLIFANDKILEKLEKK
jgi:hypothetical protein